MKASSAVGRVVDSNFSKKGFEEIERGTKYMAKNKNNFTRLSTTIFTALILTQCAVENTEQLKVTNSFLYKPFSGAMMTAGYMNISNVSDESIVINGLDCSPLIVEMHDVTTNSDGVMKMGKLSNLLLSPNETINFEPGGKHIMAWGLTDNRSEDVSCKLLLQDKMPVDFNFSIKSRG